MSLSDKMLHILLELLQENSLEEHAKEELTKLVSLREKELRFNEKILLQSDRNQRKMLELNEELEAYKKELEKRVEEETAKRIAQEKMLQQQSKMAAMGEMMDAVAHQWKQPLNALSMIFDIIESEYEDKSIDKNSLHEHSQLARSQIKHLVDTLNEFRTFFRPNKESLPFQLDHCIDAVLILVQDEFTKYNIKVVQEGTKNVVINGIENEFKHLILNMINNSKDAFIEKDIADRKIFIRCKDFHLYTEIFIEDNAGGIPEDIIESVFKPNVTSKPEGKGTGIGLYMSMQIAHKIGATLEVANTQDGVCFTLHIPKVH